jgi:uncharacterized peroxidase-related enzyme
MSVSLKTRALKRVPSSRTRVDSKEPISRLPVPAEAELPEQIRKIYDSFRNHYGFVPNWLRAFSVNPNTVYRMVTFYEHLFDPKQSRLQAQDRELIAVVTSAVNECSYCVFNHTQSLSRAIRDTIRAQRIARDYRDVGLSAREAVLAEVAEKLARRPHTISDSDFERLKDIGLDESAAVEALEIAAFFAYANRLAIALSVVPDREFFSD